MDQQSVCLHVGVGGGGGGVGEVWEEGGRGGIARWQCVGLTVLFDAVSWVPSSSDENFFT